MADDPPPLEPGFTIERNRVKLHGGATWNSPAAYEGLKQLLAGTRLRFDDTCSSPDDWVQLNAQLITRLPLLCTVCGHNTKSTLANFNNGRLSAGCDCIRRPAHGVVEGRRALERLLRDRTGVEFALVDPEENWDAAHLVRSDQWQLVRLSCGECGTEARVHPAAITRRHRLVCSGCGGSSSAARAKPGNKRAREASEQGGAP